MTARAELIAKAGAGLARMRQAVASMTPRQQAEAAWTPTCGSTVEQLEDEIRAQRGLPQIDRRQKAS